jgi:hypothetical protein
LAAAPAVAIAVDSGADSGGDRHVRGGPRQIGATGFGHEGGFGQREERSYDRRSGFNEGFGGGRNEGFAPRRDGFPPRHEGAAPRHEGFAPRGGDFVARKPSFAKPGGHGGKPFTPRGDAPKRAAGTKVLKITRG